MKHLKYVMMSLVFLCGACDKSDEAPLDLVEEIQTPSNKPSFEGVDRSFSVSFSEKDTLTSRLGFIYNGTDYNGELFSWNLNDQMVVGFDGNNSTLTAIQIEDRLKATFSGYVPTEDIECTYAFAPSKNITDWTKIPLSVPSSLIQNGKSTAHLASYMNIYACDKSIRNWSSGDVNDVLKFNHIMSYFRCSFINRTCKEIEVTSIILKDSEGNKVFSTKGTFDITNTEARLEEESPSASQISLKMTGLKVNPDSIVSGYMLSLPTILNDSLTFVVTAKVAGRNTEETFSGTFSVKKQWGSNEIKSGNVYYIKIGLTDERMKVISPKWANGVTEAQKSIIQNMIDNMVWTESGTFYMGAQSKSSSLPNYDKQAVDSIESPVHRVSLTKNFYMSKYLLTQKEWMTLMKKEPGLLGGWIEECGKGDKYPAYGVSYQEALKLITTINKYAGITFRIPTEAQWEFAARGGNQSKGYVYAGSNNVNDVAWYNLNSGMKAHEIGQKQPNELGLYDMSGNLQEWCLDFYDPEYYAESPSVDPVNKKINKDMVMVVRNNNWGYGAIHCRVARRDKCVSSGCNAAIGLRLSYMY